MSRPLNPQTLEEVDHTDDIRKANTPASATSANQVLGVSSHVAGRVVPIYSQLPTSHQTNEDAGITIGTGTTWNLPYYPTSGLWIETAESSLSGASLGGFMGNVVEQFGAAFTVYAGIRTVRPSATANNASLSVPVDIDSTWDDLTTSTTNNDGLVLRSIDRRDQLPDPGDHLDAVALGWLYADMGPFNLTCRDLSGFGARNGISSAIVQTGKTAAVVTDPDACIVSMIDCGDVGSSSDSARLHVSSLSAHGTTAEIAHTRNASTGWTVIPGANPIEQLFGYGDPLTSQVLTQPMRDLIHLDRTCYAARGQLLLSHAREQTTSHTTQTGAFWSDSSSTWTSAVRGAFFRLPDVLPGSENRTSAGSGSTAATRGALNARVIIRNAQVKIGIRKVTIAGSYGQASTFGSWTISTATHSSASWQGKDLEILFPSGIAPGDDYEIGIWWRSSGASTGYFRAWTVWEPPLTSVAP